MKAEYINIFINAASSVFEEMTQTKLKLGGTTLRQGSFYEKNVLILIGITGQIRGSVTVSMDIDYAKEIASKMMCGMPVTEFDDMPQSAVRELVNMMMGKVATLFEAQGKAVDITPPTLMTGEKLNISNQITPTLVIALNDCEKESTIDLDIAIMEA